MNINNINAKNIEHIVHAQNNPAHAEAAAPREEERRLETGKVPEGNMKDIADTLNSAARSVNQRVVFDVNDKTNRIVMKVVNTENNEVIREIPSRELMRVYEHIHELIGMFVDESR